MNIDEIKYSLQNVWNRKLRSSLTILSILIGIASIFALVSFGEGIREYVNTIADEAGRDKLFIQAKGIGAPGTDANFFITDEDVSFVTKVKGVEEIVPMYLRMGEIKFDDVRRYNYLAGYDPTNQEFVEEVFTAGVGRGRALKKGELNKAMLGHNYQLADKIFSKPIKLGDKVELNGDSFEVVGFYEEIGNPGDDANIYITEDAMEILYDDIDGKWGYVMLSAAKGVNPGDLAEKIEEKLRKFKDQDEGKEDFFVQTFEDALETFSTILVVLNGVLILIALISLVVASVNIMNAMYTAVLERTNEIGLMKAVGARNEKILAIFVFESGFLGLVGGGLGVAVGWMISSAGGAAAAAGGFSSLQPTFPLWLIIGSLLFSFLIGAGSGFLPAWRASRLRPVEALRY
ncbi:MAG: ABC transporter permease, partial [Candidatus Woesearchaeota archaeon]|nr:ABC transporter permease [Candidatus Woesearchaeota archaeon]